MQYDNIAEGRFLERPNRFIAKVRINGRVETVHVKNTGRCRELLVKDACVYLERSINPNRSTAYDLVAVKKGGRLINMDSQAPNRAAGEWLRAGGLFPDVKLVRPETKYGNSRFDFYVETERDRIFIEVKGVTLEEDGVVLFPDAPSERAVKHMGELAAAKQDGYRAIVLFVVQMEGVKYFTPNRRTHAEFAEALLSAEKEGAEILAYDCIVTPDSMKINRPVPVILDAGDEKKSEWKGGQCAIIDNKRTKEIIPETSNTENRNTETSNTKNRKTDNPNAENKKRDNQKTENIENVKEIFRKERLKAIPKILLKWYDTNKRILPWREQPTPYRVWVSEIMLQQTRVEAVRPYFERFMNALPDIKALAEADEELLLKLWEGLGYYNRVRNLQKAAKIIMEEYGGKMPDTCGELLKLPGIGSYTAGAIASIAFNRPAPAVDGNVLRVIARFRKDERFISDVKVKEAVEQDLAEIMPAGRPGDFNQAMMEIGACVCIPNGAPLCGQCPLADGCMAHRAGQEQDYPRKEKKKPRQIEERTVLVVMDENKAAIRKRAGKGLLAGLYELPSLEGFRTGEEVAGYLSEQGLKILRIQPLEEAKHIFTHREWHMKGYLVRVDELEPKPRKGIMEDWLYIEPAEARDKYPIPSAFGAYAKYIRAQTEF